MRYIGRWPAVIAPRIAIAALVGSRFDLTLTATGTSAGRLMDEQPKVLAEIRKEISVLYDELHKIRVAAEHSSMEGTNAKILGIVSVVLLALILWRLW
jgi:hypothetical protein